MTSVFASVQRLGLALYGRRVAALAVVALGAGCAPKSPAQGAPRKSQHGTVTQHVASAEIAIEYNRPVARGRPLFGGIVPWGRVWCPGADTATTIRFNVDVLLDGHTVRAGTYSVWAIPDSARWTLILSTAQPVFHVPYPEGRDALRIPVIPKRGEHVETLSFGFPMVDADSAVLRLQWGTTMLDVGIRAH
ncbi:MAG: DUF2911 domain-containing protein [Gemmatimonadaceae bacterium]